MSPSPSTRPTRRTHPPCPSISAPACRALKRLTVGRERRCETSHNDWAERNILRTICAAQGERTGNDSHDGKMFSGQNAWRRVRPNCLGGWLPTNRPTFRCHLTRCRCCPPFRCRPRQLGVLRDLKHRGAPQSRVLPLGSPCRPTMFHCARSTDQKLPRGQRRHGRDLCLSSTRHARSRTYRNRPSFKAHGRSRSRRWQTGSSSASLATSGL